MLHPDDWKKTGKPGNLFRRFESVSRILGLAQIEGFLENWPTFANFAKLVANSWNMGLKQFL